MTGPKDQESRVEECVVPFVFEGKDNAGHDVARRLSMPEEETLSNDDLLYAVPQKLHAANADAYTRYTLTIGPVNGDHVSTIEHKRRYTRYFFQRPNDSLKSRKLFNECNNLILGLAPTIAKWYGVADPSRWLQKIKERLLIDACFLLELYLRYDQYLDMKFQAKSDPIFNNVWMIPALRRDMAILNNQIPFHVLEKLYEFIKPHIVDYKPPNSVVPLALQFFHPMLREEIQKESTYSGCSHLIDLLHKFYLPRATDATGASSVNITINLTAQGQLLPTGLKNWGFHFSATELAQAGIEFSQQSSDRLVNITFKKGVIKLPPLFIDESRNSLFRNLIAHEQTGIKDKHHITSYMVLMKTLIRSPRDVKLLRKKRIITQNWIEDDAFLAHFKSLLYGVVEKDFYFADLCEEVDAYARKFVFRRKMSALYRTYFSTAWSMTAFLAATCLFILTCVQTYFTIYP